MTASLPITRTSIAGQVPSVLRWYSTAVVPDSDRVVMVQSPRGASIEARYCAIRESFVVEDFDGRDVCVSTSMWREV